jgi:hypothetical protein
MADPMTALRYELLADPLQRGYSGMTNEEVAASLDTVDIVISIDLPIFEVQAYLLFDGTLIALRDWLPANPTPGPLRTSVAALLEAIDSPRLDNFKLSDPARYQAVLQQVTIMVNGGLLTQQHADDLIGMATLTVSRASQIGWPKGVSAADVKKARKHA